MISNFHILLIGALLCLLMMLVMLSIQRSRLPGVTDWIVGNLFGVAAFMLFAYGRELPPLVAYEVADAVDAAAFAAIALGFRRFFGRAPYIGWLVASVVAVFAAIAVFHYVYDSFAARTAVIALQQGAMAAWIILTIHGAKPTPAQRSRYPLLFTKAVAIAIVLGHALRTIIYFARSGEMTALLQPSPWNLLFLSLSTVMLPAFSFGAIMMVHDRMLARLEDQANHDFLTGAWTRRAFYDLAEREILRARRNGRPMALLLIDVDHFKQINDSLGHAEGDRVLVDLVLRAESVIREGIDHFARIGGEEFALLLPETGSEAALAVAERLRAMMRSADAPARRPGYSISTGIAISSSGESLRDMMRRADQALYQAKQGGRDRVVLQSV